MAFSAVAGLAFGGIRVLFERILPERVLHREEDVEFISLHLSEGQTDEADSKRKSINQSRLEAKITAVVSK